MTRGYDYLRKRPEQHYGGSEQGYNDPPYRTRPGRERDLSAGRYGNTARRLPLESERDRGYGAGYQGRPYDSRYDPYGRTDERNHDPDAGRRYGRSGYPDEARRYRAEEERGYRRPVRRSVREGPDEDDEWIGLYVEEWRWPAEPMETQRWPGDYESGRRSLPYEDERYAGRDPLRRERAMAPKNYRRPDDRIHDDVCARLAHDHTVDVSEVTVHVAEGVVTLEGKVNDRRSKYDIEEIALDAFGVRDVVNHIHVHRYGMLASE